MILFKQDDDVTDSTARGSRPRSRSRPTCILVTSPTLCCQGPYEDNARYRDFMGWDIPWYSALGSLDTLLVGRHIGRMHLVCYLRNGDRVFETYWTTLHGVEPLDYCYALMDHAVYGRQEAWEDSPSGSAPLRRLTEPPSAPCLATYETNVFYWPVKAQFQPRKAHSKCPGICQRRSGVRPGSIPCCLIPGEHPKGACLRRPNTASPSFLKPTWERCSAYTRRQCNGSPAGETYRRSALVATGDSVPVFLTSG
jgi:Bacterial protein of unknown function (DUF899)